MISYADLTGLPGATVVGAGAAADFAEVVIDSRQAGPGSLFVALVGDRDGHDFVPTAVAAGATGLLVSRAPEAGDVLDSRLTVVVVPDTHAALQALAAAHRRRSDVDTVAVTGSVGKTTAKELLGHVLSPHRRVRSSPKSYNNDLGVPLTVLGVDPGTTTDLVAEIGTNHPGEIAGLTAIAAPRIGIVTTVGYAHVGNFGTREALAEEKASLYAGVADDGVWLVNADDALLGEAVRRLERPAATRVVTVGRSEGADVRIGDLVVGTDSTRASITLDGLTHTVEIPLVGPHFAQTAAFALYVALDRGIAAADAIASIATFGALEGRGAVTLHEVAGGGRLRVVDDSYNGSPDSVLAALATLGASAGDRKVAVLGDMRELGDWTEALHQRVGEVVAESATDLVFVGDSYPVVATAEIGRGMPGGRILPAESATDAARLLQGLLEDDSSGSTTVLLKASRFKHLERVALALEGRQVACELATCTLYIHCGTCRRLEDASATPGPKD